MSDTQRYSVDKPSAFVIVTFLTKLPFVICLKEVCFYFPYAKCTATSLLKTVKLSCRILYIFLSWEKNTFFTLSESLPVKIWSWSISVLSLSWFFWLCHQMNNLIYTYIHILLASKATDSSSYILFLCAISLRPHHACNVHIPGRAPIDLNGSSVWDSSAGGTGGEIRGRLIRVHTSDKSSAA